MTKKFFSKLVVIFCSCILSGCVARGVSAKVAQNKPEKKESVKVVKKMLSKHDLMLAAGVLKMNILKLGQKGCGATLLHKKGKVYRVLTAAHCVADYDKKTKKTTLFPAILKFILEGDNGSKHIYPAKVIKTGNLVNFEDFAVLEVEIDRIISTVPLSKSDPKVGEDVYIFTGMLGDEGIKLIKGYVSKETIVLKNLPSHGIDISGSALVQIIGGVSFGGGLSGSVVISQKRMEIIGIISMSSHDRVGRLSFIVIPISKFKKFDNKTQKSKK